LGLCSTKRSMAAFLPYKVSANISGLLVHDGATSFIGTRGYRRGTVVLAEGLGVHERGGPWLPGATTFYGEFGRYENHSAQWLALTSTKSLAVQTRVRKLASVTDLVWSAGSRRGRRSTRPPCMSGSDGSIKSLDGCHRVRTSPVTGLGTWGPGVSTNFDLFFRLAGSFFLLNPPPAPGSE
jgi:hypothetical protein